MSKAILELEIGDAQLLSLMPRCKTCKEYHPVSREKWHCYHLDMSVEHLFTPPSADFGCVLHEPKEGE